jgi:hypothetical protein
MFDEYALINNMWGIYRIEPGAIYKQCIMHNDYNLPVGWRWNCTSTINNVKGFPQILYGKNPFSGIQTKCALPIQLKNIKNLRVVLNQTSSSNGIYNLAFDMWISSSPDDLVATLTHEIMIWIDGNMFPIGVDQGAYYTDCTIDNNEYSVYRIPKNSNGDFLIIFILSDLISKDKYSYPSPYVSNVTLWPLDLNSFFKFLYSEKMLSDDLYLDAVELGTEIWWGNGGIKINKYDVVLIEDIGLP